MARTYSDGQVLAGRYLLQEQIASGGMGTVWRAEDQLLSRLVAVKLVHPSNTDDIARQRLHREALAAARLSHPNIVAVYDAGEDGSEAYIVMELVTGPTLRQIIDETGELPVATALHVSTQIADGLDCAHRNGVVHRDVKPGNVLVPTEGPLKVTDFGIAHAVGGRELTDAGTVMGTARYLAPEQLEGHPVDGRADVYALGLVLFEMLTGHPPFRGDTDMASALARLSSAAPPIRRDRPDVPAVLDDLVHRCLARAPHARPDAGALRDELLQIAGHTPGSTPMVWRSTPHGSEPIRPAAGGGGAATDAWSPVTTADAPASPRRARGWIVALAAILAIGAVLAGVLLWGGDEPNRGGATPPTRTALTIAGASDYDPLGDGREDPTHVAAAVDGDPATSWSTEMYQSFSRDKEGVGLVVELPQRARIRELTVRTMESGWDASVFVADERMPAVDGWGRAAADGTALTTEHRFRIDRSGRFVLIWLTHLPRGPGGEQLRISEVELR